MRVPNVLVRLFFEPLWDLYEGSVRLSTLRQLRKSQFHSFAELQMEQNLKLAKIVRHAAATCPFYRGRFDAAGIDPAQVRSLADLQSLPLLTKEDIRENLADILSTDHRRENLTPAKTGGSTGVALDVFCDQKGVELRHAAAMRADLWSGWQVGEPLGAVWGNPPVPITLKNKARAKFKDRLIYLDTMKVDREAIDNFLAEWAVLKPTLLFGHAHSLYILAEDLLARGLKLRPVGIVATSMMLIPSERAVIEKAFATKVTNRYGCEEVGLISCECEEHNGMHLNSENNILEFLREDGSACEPGEDGRLVITELVNFGMPMLRYEVGDWGVPSSRSCPCGRGLPLMESVTGRTADFLVAEAGFRIAGISIIENSLTKISGLRQLQIVQEKAGHLTANVVGASGYSTETGEQLIAALREMMGEGMQVELNVVEAISQEASGKYRFTKCSI